MRDAVERQEIDMKRKHQVKMAIFLTASFSILGLGTCLEQLVFIVAPLVV